MHHHTAAYCSCSSINMPEMHKPPIAMHTMAASMLGASASAACQHSGASEICHCHWHCHCEASGLCLLLSCREPGSSRHCQYHSETCSQNQHEQTLHSGLLYPTVYFGKPHGRRCYTSLYCLQTTSQTAQPSPAAPYLPASLQRWPNIHAPASQPHG